MKNNQGVTLVALVITIIVLIILAAVSLATLTGDNNIFNRAQQAVTETDKAQAKESINTALTLVKAEIMSKKYVENANEEAIDTYLTGLETDASSIGLDNDNYTVEYASKVLTIKSNDVTTVTSGTLTITAENPTGLVVPSKDK